MTAPPSHEVRVEADAETVAFVVEHGGRVWVWADAGGLKHVKTEAPHRPGVQFDEYAGDGIQLLAASDMVRPRTWNVVLRRTPYHHLDVLWDGHEPGWAMAG